MESDKIRLKAGEDHECLLVWLGSEAGLRLAKMVAEHKGNDDMAPMFRNAKKLAGKVPEMLASDGAANFGHARKR